jgi:hypothetical protein
MREERKHFFSEEKKQKTFFSGRSRTDPGHFLNLLSCGELKVFCFFSSEKKSLSYLMTRVWPPASPKRDAGYA